MGGGILEGWPHSGGYSEKKEKKEEKETKMPIGNQPVSGLSIASFAAGGTLGSGKTIRLRLDNRGGTDGVENMGVDGKGIIVWVGHLYGHINATCEECGAKMFRERVLSEKKNGNIAIRNNEQVMYRLVEALNAHTVCTVKNEYDEEEQKRKAEARAEKREAAREERELLKDMIGVVKETVKETVKGAMESRRETKEERDRREAEENNMEIDPVIGGALHKAFIERDLERTEVVHWNDKIESRVD